MTRTSRAKSRASKAETHSDGEEYEVEAICRHRQRKGKEPEFFVKWKGWARRTWAFESDLAGCSELLLKYRQEQESKRVPTHCVEGVTGQSDLGGREDVQPSNKRKMAVTLLGDDSPQGDTQTDSYGLSESKRAKQKQKITQLSSDSSAESEYKSEDGLEEEYEVEAVCGRRAVDGTKIEFLIKWKGCSGTTWVPEEAVSGCQLLVAEYERCHLMETAQDAASTVDEMRCAKCGESDGVSRKCNSCGRGVHHFCSNDVAAIVGEEFADGMEYCSVNCYQHEANVASASENLSKPPPAHLWNKTKTKKALKRKHVEPRPTKAATSQQLASPKPSPLFIGEMVAFCPVEELWMQDESVESKKTMGPGKLPRRIIKILPFYKSVGVKYLIARVRKQIQARKVARGESGVKYEIVWVDSQFQGKMEQVPLDALIRGLANHKLLVKATPRKKIDKSGATANDWDVRYERYQAKHELPVSVAEVERIANMTFDPKAAMLAPSDLYTAPDGTGNAYVEEKHKYLFKHSASSAFFAYLPLAFWQRVLRYTNEYAALHLDEEKDYLTMPELMKFLGILFYMALIDKGENANYWGDQVESQIFGFPSANLDHIMGFRQFKKIRQCLSFESPSVVVQTTSDPAIRIRLLLDVLKLTGPRFVVPGRNIAVDESSVACRSKYGRHLIVFNPKKPTGKYHFRIYMCCCATSWVTLSFRLHCDSDIAARLEGVSGPQEVTRLQGELAESSHTRSLVLEVTRPFFGSKRILNTDNYYTSVLLLDALRVKGLYGRGTVKVTSKHFPRHVILQPETSVRGDHRQGVSVQHGIIGASWCDGNIVTVISNADPSTTTNVQRLVGKEKKSFTAPQCVKEYNSYMQGVDRMDQLRSRFSVSDGHSFKKWFKKLAMAFVDFARCNAYLTRQLAHGKQTSDAGRSNRDRDPHREFMVELISQLFSGKWEEAPCDAKLRMFYNDDVASNSRSLPDQSVFSSPTQGIAITATTRCKGIASKQVHAGVNRKRRFCVICKWEGRKPTQVTDHCPAHNVCLCKNVYGDHASPLPPYVCPDTTLTCWEKFHGFYLEHKLFTARGMVRRSSTLGKAKRALERVHETSVCSTPVTDAGEIEELLLADVYASPTPSYDYV